MRRFIHQVTFCILFVFNTPKRSTVGVSHFLHGEAIQLAPLFPYSPFSILRGGVTTPNVQGHESLLELCSGRTGSSLHMNRLSSRNNRLKFKTLGGLPIILEESMEYTQNE